MGLEVPPHRTWLGVRGALDAASGEALLPMSRITSNDVIRVTHLVYACSREDLVSNADPIYQRRREMAVLAGVRLGMKAADIGRALGFSANEAAGVAEKIEQESLRRPGILEPILRSITSGVRTRRAA